MEYDIEEDRRFVPYGKKSEEVIDHWFMLKDPVPGSQ
jgi:hypothetical protein